MNRKTNIFYNTSEDSKFLTFNNYTEALTGDILAVDYKLWPSRFICVYIENLDKEDFILKLQKYYENKLAFLRDKLDDHSKLKPLSYLITFLYWYVYGNGENNLSPIEIERELSKPNNSILHDENLQFNYISDIVEQQYNGTYSDIICTINPNNWFKPSFNIISNDTNSDSDDNESTGENTESTDNNEENENIESNENSIFELGDEDIAYLHGWSNESQETMNKLGDQILSPISDEIITEEQTKNRYYVNSLIDTLKIENVEGEHQLKFNIVIPLFNVINTGNPNDIIDIEGEDNNILLNNKFNIPLGIYFTDSTINLNIDGKFSTNWSLLISTQFSAFPFSYDIQQNFDNSQSTKQAYLTFAEILANQTNFTDSITKYDNLIKSLQQRIVLLESKINNISTVQNIDGITQNVTIIQNNQANFIEDINDRLDKLERKIEESRLKWKVDPRNTTN